MVRVHFHTATACLIVLSMLLCYPPNAQGQSPEPDSMVQVWDLGLQKLDAGYPQQAADFFRRQFIDHPDQLAFLEGLSRAEANLSHQDSLLTRLKGICHDGLALRFFSILEIRENGHHHAAADSFFALAEHFQSHQQPLNHLVCLTRSFNSRIDSQDPTLADEIETPLQAALEKLSPHPRLHCETMLQTAHAFFLQDDMDEALSRYQVCRDLAEPAGFKVNLCDLLNAMGGIMAKQRRQEDAMVLYAQSVDLARAISDPRRLCLILSNHAYGATQMRKLELAQTLLLEADALARQWGFKRLQGAVHSGLGAVAEMSGDRQEAVRQFQMALDQSEEGTNIFIALGARQRMAYNQAMMGSYTEAQHNFEICLQALEERNAKFILNWVLGGLAVTNHKLGYLDRAAQYYRRAEVINREMGDRMSAAWCLNSLGVIQSLRGDYQQALVTQQTVLKEYEAIGDGEGAGDVQASIAEVYFQLGNYHEALQHCELALAAAKEAGSEELLRRVTHTTASIHAAVGQPHKALKAYESVLEIARRWDDLVVEIWALNGVAEQWLALGRKDEARGQLQLALDLMQGLEYYHVRSQSCRLMGLAVQDADQAVSWARQAVELAKAGGLPDQEWRALSDLGWHLEKLGQRSEAQAVQEKAVELVESLRQQVGSDELRRHMLRPALLPFERLVKIQMETGDQTLAALQTSERSRARTLTGQLNAALAHHSDHSHGPGDARERDLSATITFHQSQLQDPGLGLAPRDSLRQVIGRLEDEFGLLKLRWSQAEPGGWSWRHLNAAEPEDLISALEPGEHAFSYFLGTDQSYLFSVGPQEVTAHILPSREVLEKKVRRYLDLEKTMQRNPTILPVSVLQTARQELFNLLIQPALPSVDDDATLILIPDGLLHRLPFADLHSGESYLFQEHETFIAPSLMILNELRRQNPDLPARHPSDRTKILAISCGGNPQGQPAKTRLHPFTDAPVPPLAHADEEAWRLAQLFDDAKILTGGAANETAIRSGVLADADIIHWAAHSYADEVDPRRSYILLNRSESEDDSNDGLLLWHEILALDMDASLVTLASCQSAGGLLTQGEGITGLTQAFLHAGSRCVLASLKEAPDEETRHFMDLFYKELSRGVTAATALRQARLQAWESQPDPAHLPASGFVLTGDGKVTYGEPAKAWNVRTSVAMLLVLMAGVLLLWRKN